MPEIFFTPSELLALFQAEHFSFQLRGWKGEAKPFFAASPERAEIVAERKRWLSESPTHHLIAAPSATDLLQEAVALAAGWDGGFQLPQPISETSAEILTRKLGEHWEPDFLLLRKNRAGRFVLEAAAVCFPSMWTPEQKSGQTLESIHSPVPDLNTELGEKIHTLLEKLSPDAAWHRVNWGFAGSNERNQHPWRQLPHLTKETSEENVWLRIEMQALIKLPETGGILFGIQIYHVPFSAVRAHMAARRIALQLQTMPEAMRRYKGVEAVADRLAASLLNL